MKTQMRGQDVIKMSYTLKKEVVNMCVYLQGLEYVVMLGQISFYTSKILNLLATYFFFQIVAHPVFKM